MNIAYLINRYPTVSHTFIRRELIAIEQMGHEVHRFSIRPAPHYLPDAADRNETAKTIVVLLHPIAVFFAPVAYAIFKPARLWTSWQLARRMAAGPIKAAAYLAESCWLAKAMRRAGIQHVHAHFGTNPAAVARLVHQLTKIPYSFTAHGPDEFDAPVALDLAGKVADAKFAVGISDFGRSQLCRWADAAHWPKIAVVRCGVDLTELDGRDGRAEHGFDLCTVARLAPQKGLPILLEALALLETRGAYPRLAIVGDGMGRDDLTRDITRLGLSDRVVLLGNRSNADVAAQLRAAKAMVLPSFAEGLPVVIMESLGVGTPVVTTAIAGSSELVDSAVGWLVRPSAVESLADAIASALSASDDERHVMGIQGRARVAHAHDVTHNAALLLSHITAEATV